MHGKDRAAAVMQVLRLQTSNKASQSSRPKARKKLDYHGAEFIFAP